MTATMTDIPANGPADGPARARTGLAHLGDLDGFRGLSILAVLAAHMLPLGPSSLQINSMSGVMGMSIFFTLSGFLIVRFLHERPDPRVFFIRRIARIAPLLFVVSVAYALILEGRPDTFLAANLYLLNYWHAATSAATSPLWSLCVEMHFYLAIGLSVAFFGRRGLWAILPAAAVVTVLRIHDQQFANIMTHYRVDEILTGGMLALAWLHRDDPRMARVWAVLPTLFWPAFLLWLAASHPAFAPLGPARSYLAALLIGSVLAMDGGWQKHLLSMRALAYLAAISFALYVIHSPFRHGWFDAGSDMERYLFKRPLAFAAIFALAHLSTHRLEKPVVAWAKRFTTPARSVPAHNTPAHNTVPAAR